MRYLILALLLATPALAENPDGPTGAVWLEGTAGLGLGSWEYPAPSAAFGDRRVADLGGELGVVAGERVTLSLGVHYAESANRDEVQWYWDGYPAGRGDYLMHNVSIRVACKVWLRE